MKHLYRYMDLHLLTRKEKDYIKFKYEMQLNDDQIKKALYLKDESMYRYGKRLSKFIKIAHQRYARAVGKLAAEPSPLQESTKSKKEMRQELKDIWVNIHHFSSEEKIRDAYNKHVKNTGK